MTLNSVNLFLFLSPWKHGNQLKRYTETFSIFSSQTSIFKLLPVLIILNQEKKSHFSFLLVRLKKFLVQSSLTVWKVLWDIGNIKKKFQISPSTILGQSNASYQSSWQQIRTSNQFFSQNSHSFQLKWWSWDSEMEMKTMKCLNLLLRMFVSMVSPDNVLAMPLISSVFIVVNEGQCQRSNPILSFHNPLYTTHDCVPACKISHSEFRTNIFLITWNQYVKV